MPMPEPILAFWFGLEPWLQDGIVLIGLLLPLLVLWVWLRIGFAPRPLVRALLRRYGWVNVVFVLLIAVSVGMSIGLLAQERGLRDGSARAADKFDVIVAAPGSELTLLLAAVYLQPTAVPLVGGDVFQAVLSHDRVDFAAPLAFGDSYNGDPVVGTTAQFARHLSDGRIEGRLFATPFEALAGADVALSLGDRFVPAHGLGASAETDWHSDALTIVGRLARTGSPWDRAILTPIEGVWLTHAMGTGKSETGSPEETRLGPPYDPELFPGTPAIIVRASSLAGSYAVQSEFNQRADAMAFFPGTVLARLHNVLGDMRAAMSIMSGVTQILVAASVLTGLSVLTRLFRPHVILLRTLGAPTRFVMAVVWSYAVTLLFAGTAIGLGIGSGASALLSRYVTAETGIYVATGLGWSEMHLAAGFLSGGAVLSLILSIWAARSSRNDEQFD